MKKEKMLSLILYSMKLFAGISSDDPKVIMDEFEKSGRVLTRDALMMFPALYFAWMTDYQQKADYIVELYPFCIRHHPFQERNVLVSLAFEKFLEQSLALPNPDSRICRFEIPQDFKLDESLSNAAKSIKRGIQTPPIEKELPQDMSYWNWLVLDRYIGTYAFMFEFGGQMFADSEMESSFYASIYIGTEMYHSFSVPREECVAFKNRITMLINLKNEDAAIAQIRGYFPDGYVVQSWPQESKIKQ